VRPFQAQKLPHFCQLAWGRSSAQNCHAARNHVGRAQFKARWAAFWSEHSAVRVWPQAQKVTEKRTFCAMSRPNLLPTGLCEMCLNAARVNDARVLVESGTPGGLACLHRWVRKSVSSFVHLHADAVFDLLARMNDQAGAGRETGRDFGFLVVATPDAHARESSHVIDQ
jgi:hypothetical protein